MFEPFWIRNSTLHRERYLRTIWSQRILLQYEDWGWASPHRWTRFTPSPFCCLPSCCHLELKCFKCRKLLTRWLTKPEGNLTVCQKDLHCHLSYKMAEKREDEVYVLGAFDGLHVVEGQYYLQVIILSGMLFILGSLFKKIDWIKLFLGELTWKKYFSDCWNCQVTSTSTEFLEKTDISTLFFHWYFF